MTVRVMTSSDSGAPQLNGNAGSLISLLDACLVNGYGTTPALGWAKPFSGTQLGVYRPVTSTGAYFRVDDTWTKICRMAMYDTMTAVSTGTASYTGLGTPYYSAVTSSTNLDCYIMKSYTADSTSRPWILIGDERTVWFFVDTGAIAGAGMVAHGWGDIKSFIPNDAWNQHTSLVGLNNAASGTYPASIVGGPTSHSPYGNNLSLSQVASGSCMARNYLQAAPAVPAHRCREQVRGLTLEYNSTASNYYKVFGAAGVNYPDPIYGGLSLSRCLLLNASSFTIVDDNNFRGYYRGFWIPNHNRALNHLDTFSGTGSLAGKTFMAIKVQAYANTVGGYYPGNANTLVNVANSSYIAALDAQIVIETSNTWD